LLNKTLTSDAKQNHMLSWFILSFGLDAKILASRPTTWCHLASILKFWPQPRSIGQTFGLGLVTLVSALTLWPRPWGQMFGCIRLWGQSVGLMWPRYQYYGLSLGLKAKVLASTS